MSSFIQTLDDAMKALVFIKFQSYLGLTTQSTDLVFAPKSIAQRKMAEKRGATSMEFISLWRDPPKFDRARQRTPLARKGMMLEFEDAESPTDIVNVKAVPATMDYEVHFWTTDLDKLMQITEAYLFWVHTDPQLRIYFNDKYLMEIDTNFGDLVDESPLSKVYEEGTYFVYKAPIRLEGWIVTATTVKTILEINMKVFYNESIEGATPGNSELLTERSIIN